MTGPLAQLIALVSFGNDFLSNGILPPKFYRNTTFQFCNSVQFTALQKPVFAFKERETIIADTPSQWFEILKKEQCKKLALYFQGSEDQSKALDHQLAGLVGGGGTWLIEVVYNDHSDFWVNNWDVTKESAADQKIWGVKYNIVLSKQPTINLQYTLFEIRDELDEILTNIADFAFKNDLSHWGTIFENAKKNLTNLTPEIDFYHKDLIVHKNYSLLARQILFSAGLAWVFGGMGSWNDMWFDNVDTNKVYNEISARLYECINKSIIAVINS